MKRPVEERRRLLKTLIAGGAAATAATALPRTWTKPLVDAVIVPVHAQSSAPSFVQTASIAYTITGPEGFSSTVTPANTPRTHIFDSNLLSEHNYAFTPTFTVNSGTTGNFDLSVVEVIAGGDQTNFSPATQTLAPGAGGVVPFVPVTGDVDNARYAQYQFTFTPSNPAYQTYFLQVTLDETPAGSSAP